jgi:transcriptional regulator with XRE-family HTH domain
VTARLTFTGNVASKRTPTPFAALLRSLREARRVSQSKLAERAGFDHSYVSRIESGSRVPSRDAVIQMARALGLEDDACDELLSAAGFMPGDVASLLASEPEIADMLNVLRDPALSPDYRDAVRSVLRSLADQARIVAATRTQEAA